MFKKPLTVILIFALFLPILSVFTLLKPAHAQADTLPSSSYSNIDYRVIYDGKKSEVWSAKDGRNISVETFRQEIKTKIEEAKAPDSQKAVNIGILFEPKQKTSKVVEILSFFGLINEVKAFGWGGNFGAFYVYIHGPDNHALGNCVSSSVKHYNVIIKRAPSTPDRDAWANLHIGTYYSGSSKSFVIWESQHGFCWKIGGPSSGSLANYLYYAMIVSGVAASATLMWYAAQILAPILWPLLIIL